MRLYVGINASAGKKNPVQRRGYVAAKLNLTALLRRLRLVAGTGHS